MLDQARIRALQEPALYEKLMATRHAKDPLHAFCLAMQELGYPICEMDLVDAGEAAYAAMRRSTNGGGENSPALMGEEDYYELFFSELQRNRKA